MENVTQQTQDLTVSAFAYKNYRTAQRHCSLCEECWGSLLLLAGCCQMLNMCISLRTAPVLVYVERNINLLFSLSFHRTWRLQALAAQTHTHHQQVKQQTYMIIQQPRLQLHITAVRHVINYSPSHLLVSIINASKKQIRQNMKSLTLSWDISVCRKLNVFLFMN